MRTTLLFVGSKTLHGTPSPDSLPVGKDRLPDQRGLEIRFPPFQWGRWNQSSRSVNHVHSPGETGKDHDRRPSTYEWYTLEILLREFRIIKKDCPKSHFISKNSSVTSCHLLYKQRRSWWLFPKTGNISALPLFIEGVPRRGEGVLKNDLSDSPVHHLLSFKDLFNFINNDW